MKGISVQFIFLWSLSSLLIIAIKEAKATPASTPVPVVIVTTPPTNASSSQSSLEQEYSDSKSPKHCLEDFKRLQLASIDGRLDVSVSPCDDFYSYACGNWYVPYQLKKFGARDTLSAMKAKNKRILIKYFKSTELLDESELKQRTNGRKQRLDLIKFYDSCLNVADKSDSIKAYVDTLKQFSSWPILSDGDSEGEHHYNTTFNWEYVSAELRKFGAQVLLKTLVQRNWQAAEQNIIYITPPDFDFLEKSLKQDSDAFLYKTYLKYLFIDMGLRVRRAKQYAADIIDFEKQLMLMVRPNEDSVVLKAPQTLRSLANEFPEIDLIKYFETIFGEFSLPANYADKLLVVADKSYLSKLGRFLKRQDPELIGKYLILQFLAHFEFHLHEDESFDERQQLCLQQSNSFMTSELSRLFLDLLYTDSDLYLLITDAEVNMMFENVKVQFERLLNATNIFERDAVTRAMGLEKLRAMRLLLPKHQTNTKQQPEFDLSENYDKNLLKLSKQNALKELRLIANSIRAAAEGEAMFEGHESQHSTESFETNYGPLDVNAYYRLKKNAIELPVGLLRVPIYDDCMEIPTLYGSFVYILGHELLHGFDYDGLNYDKSGNVANGWAAKSIIAFGSKSNCYLQPRYDRAHANINENIADSEGLRLALSAFLDYKGGRTAVTKNDLKLFFTSFAQMWCKSGDESETPTSQTEHAAHRERVNNVLGNFPEFSEVFNCRSEQTLNPREKCRIW